PAACRARHPLRARRGAAAFARLACDPARDLDLDRVARHGLLERELELVTQVRAAIHLRAAARPGAEDIAEDVAEDVAERVRAAEAVRAEAAAAGRDTGVTEAVVSRAFAFVGQDLVGLLGLLEPRFGFRIVRVAIRVVLHRQAAIRLLHVLDAGVPPHAEHLVVIALGHTFDHPLALRPHSA